MQAHVQMHTAELLLTPGSYSQCTCMLIFRWWGVPRLYPSQPHLCLSDGEYISEFKFWLGVTGAYPTYLPTASLGATSQAPPQTWHVPQSFSGSPSQWHNDDWEEALSRISAPISCWLHVRTVPRRHVVDNACCGQQAHSPTTISPSTGPTLLNISITHLRCATALPLNSGRKVPLLLREREQHRAYGMSKLAKSFCC
jgi:hypothetical protein